MYDFAENLQERARLRHDRNVEAVGIFIPSGAPMRLDYTRKKYAGESAGENRIALAVHVRHQTLIRQVANPGVRFLLAREDADLNKRNSGKRNFAPISANTGLPGALVSAI